MIQIIPSFARLPIQPSLEDNTQCGEDQRTNEIEVVLPRHGSCGFVELEFIGVVVQIESQRPHQHKPTDNGRADYDEVFEGQHSYNAHAQAQDAKHYVEGQQTLTEIEDCILEHEGEDGAQPHPDIEVAQLGQRYQQKPVEYAE